MSFLEFTGVLVVVAGAGFGAVGLMAVIYGILILAFKHYAKKLHNSAVNWHAVHAWHKSGRPTWVLGSDRVYRMVPSSGEYTYEEESE